MRTNIVLNDQLVEEAMRYSTATTKRALIEEALETFVRVRSDEERRRSYEHDARALKPRLSSLQLRESPHSVLRSLREDR